ncbi:MAG: tetratricopeptide repeat protein [Myxococcota bacterium]|nr:tetratricopeptide repeat protein [Myxococcota bacterium]
MGRNGLLLLLVGCAAGRLRTTGNAPQTVAVASASAASDHATSAGATGAETGRAVSAASSPGGTIPSPLPIAAVTAADGGSAASRGARTNASHRSAIRLSSSDGAREDADLAEGDEAFERGDLLAARRAYQSAHAASPANAGAAVGLARVRMALLDLPLDYGIAKGNADLSSVARELTRISKEAPSFGPAFVELGRARLLLGDASGAVDALKQATRLLPDDAEAQSQLAVALLATGHAEEAVRGFSRAVELDSGSAARHGNLGTALMMNGRTKDAIVEYEARVGLDEEDARAHSDLGTALLGTQDLERALSELRRAVQLDPQRAAFHQNLGYALQQAGQVARAIAEYREALRLDPKLVSAWINLATALARDPSTRREARDALERARSLSPDDPRVKPNLEELGALEKGAAPRDAGAGRH